MSLAPHMVGLLDICWRENNLCIIVLRNRKVLTLNIKKTKWLPLLFKDSSELCNKTVILHTCWENVCSQVVENYKYLGVCLTNKYLWTNVILYIEIKMRKIMFFFQYTYILHLKKRERRNVYYGYLQSVFETEIIAWVGGEVNLHRKINNTNLYNEK